MRLLFISFILIACQSCLTAQLEFNGPLPGWSNAKERFGARGDGVHDDTRALQAAIDSLSQPLTGFNTAKRGYMVIYLPAGTYVISQTLLLTGKIGVSIIGESPSATHIRWRGKDTSIMLLANGSSYFKIGRLTWDAGNHANIEAIGIHWKSRVKNPGEESGAPTNIEISDNVFTGKCRYGISGGTTAATGLNAMDAELSIQRCVFDHCFAGVEINGYNALDYWIWDSKFMDCGFGVRCNSGNYHVYRSLFENCSSDVINTNTYYCSVRECLSRNNTHFSYDQGASTNPFKRIFQGNIILSPKETGIITYHTGKIFLVDNFFDNVASKGPVLEYGGWAGANNEVLSAGNVYNTTNRVKFNRPNTQMFSFGDNPASAKVISAPAAVIPQQLPPPTVTRQVMTATPGSDEVKLQALIDQAARLRGKRPLVYLPLGKYTLHHPLVIPAGADLQLVGDGMIYASVILPAKDFPGNSPLIIVNGPTKIMIRDLMLNQFSNASPTLSGIEFRGTDQAGSQVFVDQLYSNSRQSIKGVDLDNLYLQETSSFFSYGKSFSGGPLMAKGTGKARFFGFGSQFAGLEAKQQAIAVVKDCWWEGSTAQPLHFSGSGQITIDGAMIAPEHPDRNVTIAVDKFEGKITLLNMYVQGGVQVKGDNPLLKMLLWNIHFYNSADPVVVQPGAEFPMAVVGLTAQCFINEKQLCDDIRTIPDHYNSKANPQTFIPEMISGDREAISRIYAANGAAATSVHLSRVSAGDCANALVFKHAN